MKNNETHSPRRDSLEALAEAGVDAVVGPASSLVTLNVLSNLVGAEVLTCSPTASAMSASGTSSAYNAVPLRRK